MLLFIYTAYLLLFSLITFIAYAADKRKAIKNKWRTSEARLLFLSFFGGAIGGYSAMYLARHKTKKWYFHFVNVCGLFWQIALWIYIFGIVASTYF